MLLFRIIRYKLHSVLLASCTQFRNNLLIAQLLLSLSILLDEVTRVKFHNAVLIQFSACWWTQNLLIKFQRISVYRNRVKEINVSYVNFIYPCCFSKLIPNSQLCSWRIRNELRLIPVTSWKINCLTFNLNSHVDSVPKILLVCDNNFWGRLYYSWFHSLLFNLNQNILFPVVIIHRLSREIKLYNSCSWMFSIN